MKRDDALVCRARAVTLGYGVFAVSRHDLTRIRELHLEYVRGMQTIVAASQPNECVALYCTQLFDMSASA